MPSATHATNPMPIPTPNYLTPTHNPEESTIDIWKSWLAGTTPTTPSFASATDLIMVLKAACDHISMDLDIHADFLIQAAQTPAYGPMEIVGGEDALKEGRVMNWTEMSMTAIVRSDVEDVIKVIARAKDEIEWLTGEIGRLEGMMERAKKRMEGFVGEDDEEEDDGDDTLVFLPSERVYEGV